MKRFSTMLCLLPVALLATGSVHAAASSTPPIVVQRNVEIRHFYGYAQSLASGKYVYTEVHARYLRGGRWTGGVVNYFAADGAPLGIKVVDFPPGSSVPLYHLDLERPFYREGVSRVTATSVHLFRQGAEKATVQQATVPLHPDTVADRTGIERFIEDHFGALSRHGELDFNLASARGLDERSFRITRLSDDKRGGAATVRFKVERTSLMRLVHGEPRFFDFDATTGKLLEYRGPSQLRDPRTGKRYRVRVGYGSAPTPGAPRQLPPLATDQAH